MGRIKNRRVSMTLQTDLNGHAAAVTIGYDQRERPFEVFVSLEKSKGDLEAIVQDACILASKLMQRGVDIKELSKSIGRHSVIGHVLHTASEAL